MTCGAAFKRKTAPAVLRLKVARVRELSFFAPSYGWREKTCAAPHRQARFIFIVRLISKNWIRRSGSRKSGSASVLFWDRGAAALLDNEVAFTRPYVNYACRDDAIPYYSTDFNASTISIFFSL